MDEAPDISSFPIVLRPCGLFSDLFVKKIEIDTSLVRTSRRFQRDLEQALSSFSHIDVEEEYSEDPVLVGTCYYVKLARPDAKDVPLYYFRLPRFDVDHFFHALSIVLKLPVRRSRTRKVFPPFPW